jgi:UDP-N-acetyl-D-glucosamine dehydrogenase
MPYHVVQRLANELDKRLGLAMSNAAVLVVGVAYKKNVNDTRESPALKILELLQGNVADLAYHDPHVPVMKLTRNHPQFANMKSIDLNADSISAYDAVVVVTDHDAVDYHLIGRHSRLIVDTRNALGFRGISSKYLCRA